MRPLWAVALDDTVIIPKPPPCWLAIARSMHITSDSKTDK